MQSPSRRTLVESIHMCGIAGIIGYSRRAATENILRAMRDAQLHRGPQDVGLNAFQMGELSLGLAHTRLSILDLSSAGHQPMEDAATENWIAYNGEIYNFRQLRGDLEARSEERGAGSGEQRAEQGYQWRSQSDTEVILKAYARWGRDCLTRFRGMFAFALWDQSRRELLLARDPFGVKPLYYYQSKNVFLFASEVRALLASALVPRRLSREGVASYLESGSVQGPMTIIDGVRAVQPGHFLIVKAEKSGLEITEQEYFPGLFQPRLPPVASRGEAVEVLREKLEESVRCHLVSDVPVAAFLSGGVDSSAVVGLMSRMTDEPPPTFTVVFPEPQLSEQPYSHAVARRFRTAHRDILLTERDLLKTLPAALGAMDQPTMDGINVFAISQAVKAAGFSVAMSGLGGDELFAGYPSFRRARQLKKMAMLPRGIRGSASVLGRSIASRSVRHKKFWDMVESDGSAYAAYRISRELFDRLEIEALMPDFPGSARKAGPSATAGQPTAVGDRQSACAGLPAPGYDLTNSVSLYEMRGYMANTLLRDTDQMSMAHALEIRVPFIDPVLAAFVLGLPGNWKIDGARPKPLLLDALGDLLPEQVWRRPKLGFALPLRNWMRSALRPEIDAALSLNVRRPNLGLEGRSVHKVWQTFVNDTRQQSWSRPWALFVLTRWCEINNVAA